MCHYSRPERTTYFHVSFGIPFLLMTSTIVPLFERGLIPSPQTPRRPLSHLLLAYVPTGSIHDQDGALALGFCSPRIAQGIWLCVVVIVHDAASFVSRVATAVARAVVYLAFSAHLPLMFL